MKTPVIVGEQVKGFLESLVPEPHRKLWRGIKDLAQENGDIKQLEGRLYHAQVGVERVSEF
jgi:hypothetical protein